MTLEKKVDIEKIIKVTINVAMWTPVIGFLFIIILLLISPLLSDNIRYYIAYADTHMNKPVLFYTSMMWQSICCATVGLFVMLP